MTEARDTDARRRLVLETWLVLLVCAAAPLSTAIQSLVHPQPRVRDPHIDPFLLIVRSAGAVSVLAYVIWRSGDRWEKFGVSRLKPGRDGALGLALVAAFAALSFGVSWLVVHAVRAAGVDPGLAYRPSYHWHGLADPAGLLAVLLYFAVNSVNEELSMRGFLNVRFDELWGKPWLSIVVSSLVFASYHVYEGWGVLPSVFVLGVVMSLVFRATRSLWPSVIGHTLYNFVITLTRWL